MLNYKKMVIHTSKFLRCEHCKIFKVCFTVFSTVNKKSSKRFLRYCKIVWTKFRPGFFVRNITSNSLGMSNPRKVVVSIRAGWKVISVHFRWKLVSAFTAIKTSNSLYIGSCFVKLTCNFWVDILNVSLLVSEVFWCFAKYSIKYT